MQARRDGSQDQNSESDDRMKPRRQYIQSPKPASLLTLTPSSPWHHFAIEQHAPVLPAYQALPDIKCRRQHYPGRYCQAEKIE